MESALHVFKTLRQELRGLAQKVMSDDEYTKYLSQELQWEHEMDETLVSLQRVQFLSPKHPTKNFDDANTQKFEREIETEEVKKEEVKKEEENIHSEPLEHFTNEVSSHSKGPVQLLKIESSSSLSPGSSLLTQSAASSRRPSRTWN